MSHPFCTCLPRRPPSASFVLGPRGKQTPNAGISLFGASARQLHGSKFPPGPSFLCWHRCIRTRTVLCLHKTCGPLRPTEVGSLARRLRGLDVRLVLSFPSFPWDSCLVSVSPWVHARGPLFVCAVTEVTWLSFVSYSTLLAHFFLFWKWVVKMLLIFKLW